MELRLQRFNPLLQKTTGNAVVGNSVFVVSQVVRLDHFVHHAAFGDGEFEKIRFVEAWFVHKQAAIYLMGVDGKILAQRAAVNPSVGKDEIIVRHLPRAFKKLSIFKKHLGIGHPDA